MKFGKKFYLLILFLVILIGFFLRVFLIDSVPPGFNIDEAALGYNSFSILKTGMDEHGRFLPLSLESFGDWKLPLYVYFSIIPISILGLTEIAVRFTSITSGVIGIILIFYISNSLFNRKQIAIFSSFIFAVSPWSIFFSRAAYEVNLATTLFLGGLLSYLVAVKNEKKANLFLFISGFIFGLTLFTYHSYIIFTPLFSIFLASNHKLKLSSRLAFLIPVLLFTLISLYSNYGGASNKFTTTTILGNSQIIYDRVDKFRGDTLESELFFDRIHTKYFAVPYQFLQNYLESFSPSFLFDKAGEKLVHNLEGFGNLYIFDSLLLIVGFAGLFYFREKNKNLIVAWVLIAPISSALTTDSPNSTRLFNLMPVFAIISSYGVYVIISALKKKKMGKAFIGILVILFILNFTYFINLYFVHFPYNRAIFWRSGFEKLPVTANKYPDKKVVMQGVYDHPYIYFLFYNKYDPNKFRDEVKYYPLSYDGFRYVKSFDRYRFVHALSDEKENSDTLYIDNQNFHEGDNLIKLPNGDPVFKYYLGKK